MGLNRSLSPFILSSAWVLEAIKVRKFTRVEENTSFKLEIGFSGKYVQLWRRAVKLPVPMAMKIQWPDRCERTQRQVSSEPTSPTRLNKSCKSNETSHDLRDPRGNRHPGDSWTSLQVPCQAIGELSEHQSVAAFGLSFKVMTRESQSGRGTSSVFLSVRRR